MVSNAQFTQDQNSSEIQNQRPNETKYRKGREKKNVLCVAWAVLLSGTVGCRTYKSNQKYACDEQKKQKNEKKVWKWAIFDAISCFLQKNTIWMFCWFFQKSYFSFFFCHFVFDTVFKVKMVLLVVVRLLFGLTAVVNLQYVLLFELVHLQSHPALLWYFRGRHQESPLILVPEKNWNHRRQVHKNLFLFWFWIFCCQIYLCNFCGSLH